MSQQHRSHERAMIIPAPPPRPTAAPPAVGYRQQPLPPPVPPRPSSMPPVARQPLLHWRPVLITALVALIGTSSLIGALAVKNSLSSQGQDRVAEEKQTPTATPVIPAKKETLPAPTKKEPAECAACESMPLTHGTSVRFVDNPLEASRQAFQANKLMLVLHVSGDFEDPGFT